MCIIVSETAKPVDLTIEILKIGTPELIAGPVLKIENFDFTMQ